MRSRLHGLKTLLLATMFMGSSNAFAARAQPGDSSNLLKNGSFTANASASISGWNQINSVVPATVGNEGADIYAAASSADGTVVTGLTQTVVVHPEWAKVLLRGSIRVVNQLSAPPSPASATASPYAGVRLVWSDKSGSVIATPAGQSWLATTPGWVEVNELVTVPPSAAALEISPVVDHAPVSAYFKDLSLVAWVPTFDDNFPGTALDPSRWTVYTGKHNVNSDEQQYFMPNEVVVANNTLRIRAEAVPNGGLPYTSGQVSTIHKFQQLYGLFEFQVKLPVTDGAWPAAYLLAWDDDWPPEIDVEELSGRDADTVIETNHYADEYGRSRQSSVNFGAAGLDRTQWHTYSVVWEPGEVAWYIDGIYRGTTGQPFDGVSNVPMYININLAVGAYGGDPSQSSWPQDFLCRQVNVYQRSDMPLPIYPENSQEITLPHNTATLSAATCGTSSPFFVKWSLIDGPGPVHISDPNHVTTTATFSRPGMYRFQMKAAEGSDSNTSTLLVYVDKPIGGA